MWIAEFTNYKKFLRELIKTFPKNGRGKAAALAKHLKTSPIVISEIFNRDRELTLDQAVRTTSFFGLDEPASEYFVFMVGLARSETTELKEFYTSKMKRIREEAQKIKSQVIGKEFLSEAEKGVFYSNWYFAAVALLITVDGYETVEAIAEYFPEVPKTRIADVVSFLTSAGIANEENGLLSPGQVSVFIAEPHPQLNSHRRNWRLKAMDAFSKHRADSVHYSSPVSISVKDAEIVKKQILEFIKDFSARVAPSTAEKLMCINLDWFEF